MYMEWKFESEVSDQRPARELVADVSIHIGVDEVLAWRAVPLERGTELLAAGDFGAAGDHFARVVGYDDAALTAAALMGLGEVRFRLDDEAAAVATWMAVLRLGETPSTYGAWRNVAAARVRAGELVSAIEAYREADRRAPREDKAEIAARLGWLTKETGNPGAARRYFARSRGDKPLLTVTLVIVALTSIVSLTALFASDGRSLFELLRLDKPAGGDSRSFEADTKLRNSRSRRTSQCPRPIELLESVAIDFQLSTLRTSFPASG